MEKKWKKNRNHVSDDPIDNYIFNNDRQTDRWMILREWLRFVIYYTRGNLLTYFALHQWIDRIEWPHHNNVWNERPICWHHGFRCLVRKRSVTAVLGPNFMVCFSHQMQIASRLRSVTQFKHTILRSHTLYLPGRVNFVRLHHNSARSANAERELTQIQFFFRFLFGNCSKIQLWIMQLRCRTIVAGFVSSAFVFT